MPARPLFSITKHHCSPAASFSFPLEVGGGEGRMLWGGAGHSVLGIHIQMKVSQGYKHPDGQDEKLPSPKSHNFSFPLEAHGRTAKQDKESVIQDVAAQGLLFDCFYSYTSESTQETEPN